MRTTEARPAPLDRFRLFASTELDEAREIVARTFCDHRLRQVRAGERLDARHNHAPGQIVSLNYIRYGADVEIEPGELGSFYLIQIPISGTATIRNGRTEVLAGPTRASILNPDRHTAMRWHAGCEKILLQVDREALGALVESLSGHRLAGPVRFDPEIDLERPEMAAWIRRVRALVAETDAGWLMPGTRDPFRQLLEEELLGRFLALQPGNARHLVDGVRARAQPGHVKRALAYIRAHLDGPVSLADLATAAGVSGRTVQLGFQASFGLSPLQVARSERLKQVHFALLSRNDDTPIAELASAWGFSHMGRFSALYRQAFGCLPSETRALH